MSDLPVDNLISVDQAIAILDAVPIQPRVVNVPLNLAMGHRLAEDIFADGDYPPFDKAVMDGFAVRAGDAGTAGVTLNVIGTIAAGGMGDRPIHPGEAVAIMTGAPLPIGADAVVPIEQTAREGERVTLRLPVRLGQAVARRGSDTSAGRKLLTSGTLIGPAQIGVAATVGKSTIAIYAAPEVALLATGDELVPVDQTPTGSQIRNSNMHMLRAMLRQLGCVVHDLEVARDDPDEIRNAIQNGLRYDALFVTGGMSMGIYDYVPRLLRELGMDMRIAKLRIKPGKPFVFALGSQRAPAINPSMVFGLPGNPVSAFVCTWRLASRILKRLSGSAPDMQMLQCKTVADIPANGPRETYLPARVVLDRVEVLSSTGSADLFSLALANALVVRPENAEPAPTATLVQVAKFSE